MNLALEPAPTLITIVVIVLLLLIFAFAFGWNNSGLTTGNLSNLVNYRLALFLTLAGVLSGLVLAGQSMSSSILGKLISPTIPDTAIISGILASVVLLILLTLFRIPVSLSNCIVGAFLGAAIATQSSVNWRFLTEIVGSWFAAPFLCALITISAYVIIIKLEKGLALSTVSWINRLLIVIDVFYVSFALGANNIGLIASFINGEPATPTGMYLITIAIFGAAALGMILFGKSIAQVVGDKITGLSQIKTLSAMLGSAIITMIFTTISIPVSLTQVIIGGMLGAGIATRPSIVNRRELGTLIIGWVLVTMGSTALGYGMTLLFLHNF